jgi:hypothetical protein
MIIHELPRRPEARIVDRQGALVLVNERGNALCSMVYGPSCPGSRQQSSTRLAREALALGYSLAIPIRSDGAVK